MKVSVIISTYNSPVSLQKALWGYRYQTCNDFEIVIADDGSGQETREFIDAAAKSFPRRITHVWHEDRGFRKNEIFNKAIAVTSGEYLIITDGDCVPRDDFVQSHLDNARPNWFLTGGSHIDLPESIHQSLTEEDVASGRLFDHAWLCSQGLDKKKYGRRLTRNRLVASFFNLITPRPTVLIGCNSSVWKKDVMAVNGFDTTWSYGAEDKELGVRLSNNGVRSRRLKYSLVCAHLSHQRSEEQHRQRLLNKQRLRNLKSRKTTWVASGLKKAA